MRKDTELCTIEEFIMNTDKKRTAGNDQLEISERDLKQLAQGVGVQVRQQTIELKTLGVARLKAEIEQARKNFKATGLKHA
jgi:ribosomal protein L12E/L44/L45/RPP1/RPP2